MNRYTLAALLSLLICTSVGLQFGLSHITLNSSHSKSTISVSLSTTIKTPFTIESSTFVDTQDHLSTITPNNEDNLIIEPLFISDQETLYNDYSQNQYWLGFKKVYQIDGQPINLPDFDLMKVNIQGMVYTMLLPLFGLPLTFVNSNSLFRCQNVLVAYERIDQGISLTVFSRQQSWMVKPNALWGFRHHDHDIFYGRSVHSESDVIQIFVDDNRYCAIQAHKLPKNTNVISQTNKLSLEELLNEVSLKLSIKDRSNANPTDSDL